MTRCREAFTREHGRSPTVAEVATALGESDERILDALRAADAYRMMSLDEPLAGGEGGVLDAVGGEDHEFARAEERAMLRVGLETLAPREREILASALLRGHDAARDRAGGGGVADARLAPHPPLGRRDARDDRTRRSRRVTPPRAPAA